MEVFALLADLPTGLTVFDWVCPLEGVPVDEAVLPACVEPPDPDVEK